MIESATCIPNINQEERTLRLLVGTVNFAIALVVLAVLMLTGLGRLWRLALVPLFLMATIGYFQWREKT